MKLISLEVIGSFHLHDLPSLLHHGSALCWRRVSFGAYVVMHQICDGHPISFLSPFNCCFDQAFLIAAVCEHFDLFACRRLQSIIVAVTKLLADSSIAVASCAIICCFCLVMTALTAHSFRRLCSGYGSGSRPTGGHFVGLEAPYPKRSRDSHRHSWAAQEASFEDGHSSVEEA